MLDLNLRVTYDTESNSAYIYLIDGVKPKKTTPVTQTILFDLNELEEVIGIEILNFNNRKRR